MMMIVLGIETSCDETAASVVTEDKRILSNVVSSQIFEHKAFGGVVPEIAARAHLEQLTLILEQALAEAKVSLHDLDGIAATGGPGLIGGVMVGVMMAKGLAMATGIPFIPVNHLEAHALTARLSHEVAFPYLLLLVSGGHCQFLIAEDVGKYTYLGGTLDDALGECLDKTARLLGYGYPGGPAIEKQAHEGNPSAFSFPHPLKGQKGCSFSFSGLKTAARKLIQETDLSSPQTQADFCASFQKTIGEILSDRCRNAFLLALEKHSSLKTLVLAGGVAANQYFKAVLLECAAESGLEVVSPPPALCTDNGAMVAWAGIEWLKKGGLENTLSFSPRPRWPLEELRSPSF